MKAEIGSSQASVRAASASSRIPLVIRTAATNRSAARVARAAGREGVRGWVVDIAIDRTTAGRGSTPGRPWGVLDVGSPGTLGAPNVDTRSSARTMAKQMTPLPDAKSVRVNPGADELKELAAQMPNARQTRYGNLNVQTEVLARSKASTFLVLDDPDASSQQAISREEGERIAKLQDDYIATRDMVVVDGFIGNDPDFRTAARLYI